MLFMVALAGLERAASMTSVHSSLLRRAIASCGPHWKEAGTLPSSQRCQLPSEASALCTAQQRRDGDCNSCKNKALSRLRSAKSEGPSHADEMYVWCKDEGEWRG